MFPVFLGVDSDFRSRRNATTNMLVNLFERRQFKVGTKDYYSDVISRFNEKCRVFYSEFNKKLKKRGIE